MGSCCYRTHRGIFVLDSLYLTTLPLKSWDGEELGELEAAALPACF